MILGIYTHSHHSSLPPPSQYLTQPPVIRVNSHSKTMSTTSTPPPTLPDYVLNPDAVLSDPSTTWRHGQPPDYTKTRQFYLQSRFRPFSHLPPLSSHF